jgi:hypothetical protein
MERSRKWTLVVLRLLVFASNRAMRHCDGMAGPVVKAAQKALEIGMSTWFSSGCRRLMKLK